MWVKVAAAVCVVSTAVAAAAAAWIAAVAAEVPATKVSAIGMDAEHVVVLLAVQVVVLILIGRCWRGCRACSSWTADCSSPMRNMVSTWLRRRRERLRYLVLR